MRMLELSPLVTAATAQFGSDSGLGQHVAIESDTDHGRALEVVTETTKRLDAAVDHDDVVFCGGKVEGNLRADPATADDDDMHA